MVCQAQFASEIPFECVGEIIFDIRTNNIGPHTATKALWLAGCAITLLDGKPDVLFSVGMEDVPATADGIAARLEELCSEPGADGQLAFAAPGWKPNPERIKAIVDLVIKLLPIILPLIV